MLRLRPGILLIIVLVFGIWLWQARFREYSPFSDTVNKHALQVEFKQYALNYYPIHELKFLVGGELWIRLKQTQDLESIDAQRIVEDIADDYRARTGIAGGFTVYLLHPVNQEVIARTTR